MTPARSIALLVLGVGLVIWGLIGVLSDDAESPPADSTQTTVAEPASSSGGG